MSLISFHESKFPSSVTAALPLVEPWTGALAQRRPSDLVRAAHRADGILAVLGAPTVTGPLAKLPADVLDPSLLGDVQVYLRAVQAIVAYQSEMRDVLRARLVPKELRLRSQTLLRRMVGVARHTLGHVDEVVALVRSASQRKNSFAEGARGLRTLAAIYAAYPQDVVRDGQNYRSADAAEALTAADELERVLRGVVVDELERIADRVWTRLVGAYAKILAAVHLVCDELTRSRLPGRLNSALRPRHARRKTESEVASPADTPVQPAPSPAPTIHLLGGSLEATPPATAVA